ncbi:MAG: peptidase C39 family protein [Fimbriimonadaceae bacterium]
MGPHILLALQALTNPATGFEQWQPGSWERVGDSLRASVVLRPKVAWRELVLSWNTGSTGKGSVTVLASAEHEQGWTKDYVMGEWGNATGAKRTSVNDQVDEDGKVLTDTLVLARAAGAVRVTLVAKGGGPRVEWVGASFRDPGAETPASEPNREAWGKVLEPPRLFQMDYPNGDKICSPTALSMILGFWARELGKPTLASGVVETCQAVFDPGWDGTGNWSFNVAFAGSKPGLRALVTRLAGMSELEDWIARGWPVACSVSNGLLRGKGFADGNDGHLVVLVGFTAEGEPVFNDPGRSETRQTYRRSDFEAAWAKSGRTVYLVYPSLLRPPHPRFGNWPR